MYEDAVASPCLADIIAGPHSTVQDVNVIFLTITLDVKYSSNNYATEYNAPVILWVQIHKIITEGTMANGHMHVLQPCCCGQMTRWRDIINTRSIFLGSRMKISLKKYAGKSLSFQVRRMLLTFGSCGGKQLPQGPCLWRLVTLRVRG